MTSHQRQPPQLIYRVSVCGDPAVSASARANCACSCGREDGLIIDLRDSAGVLPGARPWQWYQTRAGWFGAG